jgi:Holliday junction DNA helicase RuvA
VVVETADGVVLDVAGVGYELTLPLGVLGRAPRNDAGAVTLMVHTHVREDDISLFGFANEQDRAAFRTLIGVSNVGPRTALAVLSALPADELARAIAQKDTHRLTAISGVGKKTAERLVLELRDKLAALPSPATGPTPVVATAKTTTGSANGDLLHGALTRMGYRPSEADRAVEVLKERVDAEPLQELLREALAILAR